eukprot:scaffold85740_cov66-Phaeocystis_antarctica.AAC.10
MLSQLNCQRPVGLVASALWHLAVRSRLGGVSGKAAGPTTFLPTCTQLPTNLPRRAVALSRSLRGPGVRLALQHASYARREDVLQHLSHRRRVGVHELHEEGVEAREMPAHERRCVAVWQGGAVWLCGRVVLWRVAAWAAQPALGACR